MQHCSPETSCFRDFKNGEDYMYVLTLTLNTVVNLYVISDHPLMAFIAGLLYK
jgi:hypothetical protein